uniref:Uncharacterized protein n=1 Tax=Hyaloperonospora arabidopsidis (strain Emoy2) TaxID=559515 RepID=M4B7K8_HYAAE
MLLEAVLLCVILWRTLHQLYWRSHPRRVWLHICIRVWYGVFMVVEFHGPALYSSRDLSMVKCSNGWTSRDRPRVAPV